MSHNYPVSVTAELDPHLSRGLWLVKWLLAIPHYLVLIALWIAFAATSLFALFAILFTGVYPRAIFDFNVGVMRWTWRVTFYAYGALGTDRYPPFTLKDVADYPAHLDVAYPEHLSRGLVLVKWWLLALPHYLVVALFVGGGLYGVGRTSNDPSALLVGGGLVGILVLIAAAALLFTGRYPRSIFNLVIGLQRWVIRVAAYAALMTDVYPPFRLDQGGASDSSVEPGPPPDADPAQDSPKARGSGAAIVTSIILLVISGFLMLGAGSLLVAQHTLPDEDGFFMTAGWTVDESTYAITSESIDIPSRMMGGLVPSAALGAGKITITPTDGMPLFVGVGRTADVRSYLRGVASSTITSMTMMRGHSVPLFRRMEGGAPPHPPESSDFWIARMKSTGQHSLTWSMHSGDWTVVVMRADGARGIAADIEAGATFPAVNWIFAGLCFGSGVFLLIGLALLIGALSSRRPPTNDRTSAAEHAR